MAKKRKYPVELTDEQRNKLQDIRRKGEHSARTIRRAHSLLLSDDNCTDGDVAEVVGCCAATVLATRRRFFEEGLESALSERPRSGRPPKLTAKGEARLVAEACSTPPEGRSHWTMQLLADRAVELELVESISDETVRVRLKKKKIKPWLKRQWAIPRPGAAFVCRMEEILDLYQETYDPDRPVVCFDERPCQLVDDIMVPIAAKPGSPAKVDSQYERCGSVNLFVMVEPLRGWRRLKVTERRTKVDFAECMRELVDEHFPEAETIRVVLDNLNTHYDHVLYDVFEPAEAHRLLEKLEFHYTPVHGSWLNQAEIELSAVVRQALNYQRIATIEELRSVMAACEAQRNDAEATIDWIFDIHGARDRLERLYPEL